MSVSEALKQSAEKFNTKYGCDFDFTRFESRVEEFTLLRPNNGWKDVYKATFERMYTKAFERVALGTENGLNGEAMLDDFEYTLIRPYVSQEQKDIKHNAYIGMDRLTRLEYLFGLTEKAPKNLVELYAAKYKNGDITLKQMRDLRKNTVMELYIEAAGVVQALKTVNNGRSSIWKAFHPYKNKAEKTEAELMQKSLVKEVAGVEEAYRGLLDAAYEVFDGYQKTNANLGECIARAREEMTINQKMNDAMRETFRIDDLDKGITDDVSRKIERDITPVREKAI